MNNNKSRERPGKSLDDKFLREYYSEIKEGLADEVPPEVLRGSPLEELKRAARLEFVDYFRSYPSTTVFAPAALILKRTKTKSISMAVQFGTLIVGDCSPGTRRCQVKILSEDVPRTFEFRLTTEPRIPSVNEPSWVEYVDRTARVFKARQGYVPGFKIVIAPSLPLNGALVTGNALIVAVYTFLEAITARFTAGFEKAVTCHLIEEEIVGSRADLVEPLTSVFGMADRLLYFDKKSVQIDLREWRAAEIVMILIEIENGQDIPGNGSPDRDRVDLTDPGRSLDDDDEDDAVSRMMDAARDDRWMEFGELLWDRRNSTSCSSTERSIVDLLRTVPEVCGAKPIGPGPGVSVLAMVQRSGLERLIGLFSSANGFRCRLVEPSSRAAVLSSSDDPRSSWPRTTRLCGPDGGSPARRYYLSGSYDYNFVYGSRFDPSKSISLLLHDSAFV